LDIGFPACADLSQGLRGKEQATAQTKHALAPLPLGIWANVAIVSHGDHVFTETPVARLASPGRHPAPKDNIADAELASGLRLQV
jgi:hypothetical protein